MQTHIPDLVFPPCPACGGKPKMFRDASSRFIVRCDCGRRTAWLRQPLAIISWFAGKELKDGKIARYPHAGKENGWHAN